MKTCSLLLSIMILSGFSNATIAAWHLNSPSTLVPSSLRVPENAVGAGSDESRQPYYICRIPHAGGLMIGKWDSSIRKCVIGFNGHSLAITGDADILTSDWDEAISGRALAAGYSMDSPPVLYYPCQAYYGGALHPGSTDVASNGCRFSWDGMEIVRRNFRVLGSPWLNKWVPSEQGRAPTDAAQGGYDANGRPYYICRAEHTLAETDSTYGLYLGKVRKDLGGCNIAVDGREYVYMNYETLVANWSASSNGLVPANAVSGGNEPNGSPLWICRAKVTFYTPHRDNRYIQIAKQLTIPGKLNPATGGCSIAYKDKELIMTNYEVLTEANP